MKTPIRQQTNCPHAVGKLLSKTGCLKNKRNINSVQTALHHDYMDGKSALTTPNFQPESFALELIFVFIFETHCFRQNYFGSKRTICLFPSFQLYMGFKGLEIYMKIFAWSRRNSWMVVSSAKGVVKSLSHPKRWNLIKKLTQSHQLQVVLPFQLQQQPQQQR